MGTFYSPSISTDSLIFYYDMGNTKKSWLGKPITNQYAVPTPAANGDVTFSVNGTGTFKRIYSGTYGGYEIRESDIVYRYDLGGTGCHYHGNSAAIGAGQYATFTFDYYISQNAANYPTTNYLANFENYGGSALSAGLAAPNSTRGVWQTVTLTAGPTAASGTQAMFLYPGACGSSYLASSGYILYKNPQVIFGSTSNETRPFTSSSRSTSQAVVDLTKNHSITASSLTYASDNTFSFNGSSDYLQFSPSTQFGNISYSIEFVLKVSATSGNYGIMLWASSGPFNSLGKGIEIRFQTNLFEYTINDGVGASTRLQYTFANIADGNYRHFVITQNKQGTATLYVNGVSVGTQSYTGESAFTDALTFQIGKGNDGYLNGLLPVFKLYTKALTGAEVQQNYNVYRGRYGL